MGKAIYVMDTPKACDECPLSLETETINTIICRGCEKYSINPKCTERPDWCPLKELPEKWDFQNYSTATYCNWMKGFNSCLDKILNGGKENV